LTHRNPVEAIASYCSMMETLLASNGFARHPGLGEVTLDFCATSLERGYAVRDAADPARFLDLRFADFVSDGVAAVRRIYDHFELPLSAEAEEAMTGHVRENPRGKHGAHEYDLGRYGLTEAAVRDRFGWYIDRFELG